MGLASPIPWCDWVEQRLASASVLANMVLISLVALAIVMLVLRRETRPWAIWAVGVLLYFGATTAMFEISNYRYRLVVEPLMAALVAAAIAIWTTGEDESADDRQTV